VGKVSWDFVQSWKLCIEPEEEEEEQQQQQNQCPKSLIVQQSSKIHPPRHQSISL
jgi:hypothetical protein